MCASVNICMHLYACEWKRVSAAEAGKVVNLCL